VSPEQIVFTELYRISTDLGFDTYDYLPDSTAQYPFVHIGEQFVQSSRSNKTRVFPSTQITLHVWHNDRRKRGTVSTMLEAVEKELWQSRSMRHLDVQLNNVNKQILTDNSTASYLLHGTLEPDFNIQ